MRHFAFALCLCVLVLNADMHGRFVATNRRVTAVWLSVKGAAYADANVKEIKVEVTPSRISLVNRAADKTEGAVVEPRAPKDVPRAMSPEPTRAARASAPPGTAAYSALSSSSSAIEIKSELKRLPSPDKGK